MGSSVPVRQFVKQPVLQLWMAYNVWLNYVFAGEAQIWNLGSVAQRFLFLTSLFSAQVLL